MEQFKCSENLEIQKSKEGKLLLLLLMLYDRKLQKSFETHLFFTSTQLHTKTLSDLKENWHNFNFSVCVSWSLSKLRRYISENSLEESVTVTVWDGLHFYSNLPSPQASSCQCLYHTGMHNHWCAFTHIEQGENVRLNKP